MHDTAENPIKRKEILDSCKTQEDIDYWKKVIENNKSANIILDDP